MSQSDYLKRKRIATTLRNDSTRYPVFSERNLLDFKQFSLENSITHDKELINRVLPENKRLVFNIEQTVDSCPSFIVCTGTHARPNRQPLVGKLCQIFPLTWQEQKEASEIKYNQCACPAT